MTIKMSDSLMQTAGFVKDYAQGYGIPLRLTEVYTAETAKSLALIAALVHNIINEVQEDKIEVINA